MTIFKTAYDTTATQGFRMDKTVDAIQRAWISGELKVQASGVRVVEGGRSVVDAVPQFEHPLWIEDSDKQFFIAYDARPFGKVDRLTSSFIVRDGIQYDTATLRAKLNYVWLTETPNILRDISQLPAQIFAAWMAESITRRFVLDPEEQLRLAVLAAYHYQCLFTDAEKFDERELGRVVKAVSMSVNASAEQVYNLLSDLPVLQSISDFCAHAEKITGSVRLKELNPALLITLLGGSWFGHNHKEMIAVALEHPPTWLAIVAACYQSRTFKNSQVARVAEIKDRQQAGQNYLRSVIKMTNDIVGQ